MTSSGAGRLVCSSCGSAYPLDVVRGVPTFTCSVCGNVIVVPVSVPGAVETPPPPLDPPPLAPPTPPPLPDARAPAPRTPARGRSPAARAPAGGTKRPALAGRTRSGPAADRTGQPYKARRDRTLAIVGISVAAAIVLAIVIARSMGGGRENPAGLPGGETASSTGAAPQGDPKLDPAVWRALPASERALLREETLDLLDPENISQLRWAADFFADRGEDDARKQVAEWAFETDPSVRWPHKILGVVDCAELMDTTLAECPRSEELVTAAVLELESLAARLNRPNPGKWFPPPEAAARVRELAEQIRADEKRLSSDYAYGVERWVNYYRTLEGMKEFPAVHEAFGPYLVFAQVGGAKKADLSDADPGEVQRARRLLAETKELYTSLYDGWMDTLGTPLGMTRYDETNTDFDTLLKVNVFARTEEFQKYCEKRHGGSSILQEVGVFYSLQEPRFVVTNEGAERSDITGTQRMVCHAGIYQLAHFYTRQQTMRARDVEPGWGECDVQPLWSDIGFAGFFACFEFEDGRRVWMQPSDHRMEMMWITEQAFPLLSWKQWSLHQILSFRDRSALREELPKIGPFLSDAQKKDKRWLRWRARIEDIYERAFYARAWSLAYFLWHADDRGRPKYRDKYLEYMKRELMIPEVGDANAEYGRWTEKLFIDVFGLESSAAFQDFEAEWRLFVSGLAQRNRQPSWEAQQEKYYKLFGLR